MTVTVDATVGGLSANSYVTVEDANTYLEHNRLFTDEWSAADFETRARAIIWATRILDASYEWVGAKFKYEQALRWPRSGALDPDGDSIMNDEIPRLLKDAVAELAYSLIQKDRTKDPALGVAGISFAKVGSLEVRVDTMNLEEVIPDYVKTLLVDLGVLRGSIGRGSKTLRLRRT